MRKTIMGNNTENCFHMGGSFICKKYLNIKN